MSNARWQPTNPTFRETQAETQERPATGHAGPTPTVDSNDDVAAWPGVPGPIQTRDRSNGVPRRRNVVRSEGF